MRGEAERRGGGRVRSGRKGKVAREKGRGESEEGGPRR